MINGVDPARILMLTFTRRAAIEMRRRAHDITRKALDDALGGGVSQTHLAAPDAGRAPSTRSATACCATTRAHLKLDPQFSVIDRGDAADLMDSLRQELGLAGKEQRFPRKETCLQIYSYRVNTQRAAQGHARAAVPVVRAVGRGPDAPVPRLRRAKQHAHLLDYDDLLLYWHVDDGRAAPRAARRRALRPRAGR